MADAPTDHLDDEVLSAVLDDEATAAEAAHAGTCPVCSARLDALRVAAAHIAAPVEVDPSARDAAVRRALDQVLPAGVTSLDARRRRRMGAGGIAAAVLAAAAVAALVAIPLSTRQSATFEASSPAQATTTALDAFSQESSALRSLPPQAAAGKSAADAGGSGASTTAYGPDLGELADTDLRQRLADQPRTEGGPEAACEPQARTGRSVDAVRTLAARGTWHGAPAIVIVLRDGGIEHAVVLTSDDCAVVSSFDV